MLPKQIMIIVFTRSSYKVQIKRINKSRKNSSRFIMVKLLGGAIQGAEEDMATETIFMKTFPIQIAVFRETIVAERMGAVKVGCI